MFIAFISHDNKYYRYKIKIDAYFTLDNTTALLDNILYDMRDDAS